MDINKAIISGRLTQEPKIRKTNTGKSVTSMTVATNSSWTDDSGEKQEKTEYHNVVVWGKSGEAAAKHLIKGQQVLLEGRIETGTWKGKDGSNRHRTELVVSDPGSRLEFGQKPKKAGNAQNSQEPESKEETLEQAADNALKRKQDKTLTILNYLISNINTSSPFDNAPGLVPGNRPRTGLLF